MLNINELESQWRTYKIKSYIPHAVIAISLGVIFILISTIYSSKTAIKIVEVEKKESEKIEKKEVPVVKKTEQNITQVVKAIKPDRKVLNDKLPENNKIILSPSLSFMSNMRHDAISYYENDNVPASTSSKAIEKPITQEKEEKRIEKQQVVEIEVQEEGIVEKNIISIKRQDTQEDISHVIKRFKKNNNPALSLFVAKKYYGLGEYHKAYNYALMTNEINDNIDASWIIFAKSLVKLNEKEEAIKTLKKYIEHSHSSQAKILLEEIVSGKFK